MGFFQSFEVVAEVAHVLRRDQPVKTVYIDVCTEPAVGDLPNVLKYPTRTTLTVTDPEVLNRIPDDLAPGAVVRARGTFQQGSYVPYKTSQIDTTFELADLEVLIGNTGTARDGLTAQAKPAMPTLH